MRAAEIAGVADDESVPDAPCAAQLVVMARDGPDKTPVRPIRNDPDFFRRGTQAAQLGGHALTDRHIQRRLAQRPIAQPPEQRKENAS